MDFLGIKKLLHNREGKLQKLAALKLERETKLAPLQQAVRDSENEQKRLKEILAGDPIRVAQKKLSRTAEPIDTAIRLLTVELTSNPPTAITTAIEADARLIAKLRAAIDTPLKTSKSDRAGNILEAERYDAGQVNKIIEIVSRRMQAVGALALEMLTEPELTKRIEALRQAPLPEIRPVRFFRESAFDEFQELQGV